MTISTKTIIDKIEVLQFCQLQVRQAQIIEQDGTEISRIFTRWICAPGDDVSSQDPKVQAIANALWTSDVISAYKASMPQVTQI